MAVWKRALSLAAKTPAKRNRAVDFYRVVALLVVVTGHWLVNAFHYDDGELTTARILTVQPWTQYLTWLFQVMPVFFVVGGYANAASWASALESDAKRRVWAGARVRRLLLPIVPLVLLWVVVAVVANLAGMSPDLIRSATRGGLIPTWFLAVYVLVTLLVPATFAFWRKAGFTSVLMFVFAAGMVDFLAFTRDADWLRWVNYGFAWLAAHQLGYWWQRRQPGKVAPVLLILFGVGTLWLLVGSLGYPVSMISIPGAEVSNSSPPTFAMLAIGAIQAGLMLLLSDRLSRWLAAPSRWAAVIVVGARMMTIYLWHTTALVAALGIALLLDGAGLRLAPGSGAWWLARLGWIAVLAVAILPFLALFGWVEGRAQRMPVVMPGRLRVIAGALVAGVGIAFLALQGTSAHTALGLNLPPILATLGGVALATWRGRQGQ